jgi:signal peptide peptidase SppA
MSATNYRHILATFYGTPLGLLPEKLEAIRAFLHRKAAGEQVSAEEVAAIVAARRDAAAAQRGGPGGRIALLPVFGVLSQRVGLVEQSSGGISTEAVGQQLDQLAADRGVECIVLVFDSPGGSVFGVQELADKIRKLRGEKTVVGVADSMTASAAYWLLSQCSEVNVTPGGQVGSIGVLAAHEDHSAELEQAGVKVTLVSAGKYKAEGTPYGPLGADARAEIQAKVDHYYGLFVAGVASGRGVTEATVRNNFGQGRMATAREAVQRGMADRVATLQQVVQRLLNGDGPGSRGNTDASAAEALRLVAGCGLPSGASVPTGARLAQVRARLAEVEVIQADAEAKGKRC